MNYDTLVGKLNIKKGDRIWLSSEVLKLALQFREEGIKFDGSSLINSFQKAIGNEGTLMMPTFSFEFSNSGRYDINKTRGITGVLGNIGLARDDFVRTRHPMHSFVVWGRDSKLLSEMSNINSFGIDSPFGYCVRYNVRQIILGTDYVHAMTFIHYAEAVCNVPYRFIKSFTGTYVDGNGASTKRTYDYFARRLEIEPVEIFNEMGTILEKNNISKKIDINGLECYDIDLAKSFPLISDDIISNQCKNLYEFNVDRQSIFIDKGV